MQYESKTALKSTHLRGTCFVLMNKLDSSSIVGYKRALLNSDKNN